MGESDGVPWHRSMRLRLALVAIAVEALMLALLLANSFRLLSEALESQTRARLEALAPLIDASLAGRVFERDHAEIAAILHQLVKSASPTDIRYMAVFGPQGQPLAAVGPLPAPLPDLDRSVGQALSDRVFDAAVPLTLLGNEVGSVRYGLSLTAMVTSRDRLMQQGMLIAAAEVLLSLLLLTSGGYLITRHIPTLLAATRRIARGDYGYRIPLGSRDEVGLLAANFNTMSAAVEERIAALAESETRFREIFDTVGEAIFIHDPATGAILDVNRRMCEMYRCTREQAIAAYAGAFSAGVGGFGADEAMDWVRRAVNDGPQVFEWRARTLDGHPFWVEVSLRLARIGEETRLLAVVRDIGERKQHLSEIEFLAHHDALTRLPNRVLLADRLQQAIAQSRRAEKLLAVGYLDLDGFKPVNDAMGHEAGDQLLLQVAGRIRACVRGGDTVSRFGGDEFVVLLCELATVEECAQAFSRMLAAIGQPFLLRGQPTAITASAGVTMFPLDDAPPDALIRHADQAMYGAKQAGRNRYHFFDPERDQLAKAHLEVRSRIEEGLGRREFLLHYQPQVDLATNRVIGAEALIRWQHPERGLVMPGQFLPAIDDTDFAVTLGRWVIHEAVAQLDEWRAAGLDLAVSINVAARHLQSPAFVADLEAVLGRHPRVPPAMIELEVLETTALEDTTRVASVIDACHRLGVKFALDDFGTGYASLAYFKRLQVDTLKIDQSFVRDMLEDKEDRAIVEGVIGLTRVFRRQVVAEGVETAEHARVLLAMGCHLAQGYGIARPMPAAAVPAWVATYSAEGLPTEH